MSEDFRDRENRGDHSDSHDSGSRGKYPKRSREDGREDGGYKSKTAKRKVCRFCADLIPVDYKNTRVIKSFITERSKIVPGRITGTCAVHQRELTVAVKRARHLALVPYTSCHNF